MICGHQLAGVLAGEPGQIHPGDPVDPVQLGQQRAQRMGAVQLVGPVGHHDQHAVQRPLVADQEGQQVPGGPVGPVRVLDDQDHRAGFGQLLQQDEHLLEQPRPRLARVPARRLAELRQQPGQLPGAAAGQQLGDPSAPRSRTSSRSTAVNGANGRPSAPSSRQPPMSTRAPAPRDRSANSLTSRDLPTPASPPTRTADGLPRPASASAAPARKARRTGRPEPDSTPAAPISKHARLLPGSTSGAAAWPGGLRGARGYGVLGQLDGGRGPGGQAIADQIAAS